MVYSLNDEQEAREIRRAENQGEYLSHPDIDRQFGQNSAIKECESLGANRNNSSSGRHPVVGSGQRAIGKIVRQLINEYRDQVAKNKNEILRLESKISELEMLEGELNQE